MSLRQRIDIALASLDGDTGPVRSLCLGLGRRLRRARADLAEVLGLVQAEMAATSRKLDDVIAAARERNAREAAQVAAREGEVTALKADPLTACWGRATAEERAEFRRWLEEHP
jgi:hypothetical protein